MDQLIKTKTFWTGIGGMTVAAGGYFIGEFTLVNVIQIAATCLLAIFIRHGMIKGGRP